MISLFLDSSSYYMIIGLYEDNRELYLIKEKNDNQLSERLLPAIQHAFKQVNKRVQDIKCIYVVNGPGSFTGTRIGVTVAKVLAWSLHIKVIPISELEVIASGSKGNRLVSIIDARREFVYAGIYDEKGNVILKDQYISLEELLKQIPEEAFFLSYDSVSLENVHFPELDIPKIIERHQKDPGVNCHKLNPNYLKLTEAEENKNVC